VGISDPDGTNEEIFTGIMDRLSDATAFIGQIDVLDCDNNADMLAKLDTMEQTYPSLSGFIVWSVEEDDAVAVHTQVSGYDKDYFFFNVLEDYECDYEGAINSQTITL